MITACTRFLPFPMRYIATAPDMVSPSAVELEAADDAALHPHPEQLLRLPSARPAQAAMASSSTSAARAMVIEYRSTSPTIALSNASVNARPEGENPFGRQRGEAYEESCGGRTRLLDQCPELAKAVGRHDTNARPEDRTQIAQARGPVRNE